MSKSLKPGLSRGVKCSRTTHGFKALGIHMLLVKTMGDKTDRLQMFHDHQAQDRTWFTDCKSSPMHFKPVYKVQRNSFYPASLMPNSSCGCSLYHGTCVMKVLAHDDDPFWLWHNIFSQTNNSKHPMTSARSQYYWIPFQMSEQKMDMTQP